MNCLQRKAPSAFIPDVFVFVLFNGRMADVDRLDAHADALELVGVYRKVDFERVRSCPATAAKP